MTGMTADANVSKRHNLTNPMTAVDQLDERKSKILRAIVEEYISTAQPVGSRTVVDRQGLNVSAATVRNEMGALERDGYIAQPHTSAGRIPTDRGYRFFVDNFAPIAALPNPQRKEVAEFFGSASRAMDDLLHETSHLLSRLTHHAAVIVGPVAEESPIRALQLVLLAPRLVLVVAILANGVVEKESLPFESDVSDVDVAAALQALSEHCVGLPLSAIGIAVRPEGVLDASVQALADRVCRALQTNAAGGPEPLFVGGASQLAAEGEAFQSPASVARLLGLLEQQVVVVAVMRELLGPGLTVTIGSENSRDDLRDCSLVLAPYVIEGAPAGTVGVLGPTRMDYRQAQAAVSTVSSQLSRELSR